MKKLTIIIPCYNMEKYIKKALYSIVLQNKEESFYDVYIIDDGSQDKSCDIVNQFIIETQLKNFYLIQKKNGNWGSVINYAKENGLIKSEYVTILDADDFYSQNCFNLIEKHMEKKYDLIFSGFWEIKAKKTTKGYLIPFKGNRKIDKKYMRFPSLIPLCKFFKTEIFNKVEKLKEDASYQDIILWNKFVDLSETFYYEKQQLGYYLNHREGASSTQPFNENRINELMIIINNLISDDKYTNGYLMALLMHIKKNTSKNLHPLIFLNDKKKINNFKLLWCPFGTRLLVKLGMRIYLRKILY